MCGRFTLTVSESELNTFINNHFCDIKETTFSKKPRYNIAPGQPVLAIIYDGNAYRIGEIPWGIPMKHNGALNINAREETLRTKPLFSAALKLQRCIILADGFYEWKNENGLKKPLYFRLKETPVFGFAGLYKSIESDLKSNVFATTIITTKANALIKPIHDRMPVILTADAMKTYLDYKHTSTATASKMLVPFDAEAMSFYPVSDQVNRASFDSVQAIQPIHD